MKKVSKFNWEDLINIKLELRRKFLLNNTTLSEEFIDTTNKIEEINLKVNKMKEIIGYKLIKPKYKSAINNITDAIDFNFKDFETEGIKNYTKSIQKLTNAGVLDLWFEPIYKEEPKYKVGDWVIANYCSGIEGYKGKIAKIISSSQYRYLDGAIESNSYNFEGIRHATPEEIKKAERDLLLEEAKKRYPVGTRFYVAHLNKKFDTIGIIEEGEDFKYETPTNNIIITGTSTEYNWSKCVYDNGKWAEIITTPDIKINGYQAEFFDNYVKFGCVEVSKATVLTIDTLLRKHHVDLTNDKNLIKEIAEYYTKK